MKDVTILPVDACTILGMLMIQATLLPNNSFGVDGTSECVAVLQALEENMNVNATLELLPHCDAFAVEIQQNCLQVSALKRALRELGLGWARQGLYPCNAVVSRFL